MNRRGFLSGILAVGMAPAFVGSGVLMPIKKIWTPEPTSGIALMRAYEEMEISVFGSDRVKVSSKPSSSFDRGELKIFTITESNGIYKRGQTFTIAGIYG